MLACVCVCLIQRKISKGSDVKKNNYFRKVSRNRNILNINHVYTCSYSVLEIEEISSELQAHSIEMNAASGDIEAEWKVLQAAIRKGAETVLGKRRRDRNDWFNHHDATIHPILDELHKSHLEWMNDKNNQSKCDQYHQAKPTAQSKIRKMKEDCWGDRARGLQEAADRHYIRAFYQELKTVHGLSFRGATPVKDASGNTLLTEPSAIVQRWAEHFEQVWSSTSIVDNAVFGEIPQQPTLEALAAPIQLEEVKTVIKALKNGKAPGTDGLAPEIFK